MDTLKRLKRRKMNLFCLHMTHGCLHKHMWYRNAIMMLMSKGRRSQIHLLPATFAMAILLNETAGSCYTICHTLQLVKYSIFHASCCLSMFKYKARMHALFRCRYALKILFSLRHHVLIKSIDQDEGTHCSNCDITNTSQPVQ